MIPSSIIAAAVAEAVRFDIAAGIIPIVTTPRPLVTTFAAYILPVVVVKLEHHGPIARSPTVVRIASCLRTALADSRAVDAAAVADDFVGMVADYVFVMVGCMSASAAGK